MRPAVLCLVLACVQASGQIVVRIKDAPPVTLSLEDLGRLPRHTALLNDHAKQISYEGPLVHDVLAQAGIDFGKGLHGSQLSTYVAAQGSDGYQVVYALADFDPSVGDAAIIVALKRDGQPLAANEGPLRIIVPQDKRPTRSVRLLQEIVVVQLKK